MKANPAKVADLLRLITLGVLNADPTDEAIQAVIDNPEHSIMRAIRGLETFVQTIVSFVMNIITKAVNGKKTAECFKGTNISNRDGDIDLWLLADQKSDLGHQLSVNRFAIPARFSQFLGEVVSYQGNEVGELKTALKARLAPTSLVAIDDLLERSDKGEDVALNRDGMANFFLVEGKDGGNLAVLHAYRGEGGWDVGVRRLDIGHGWGAGHRFFLSNLSAS